MQYMCHWYLVRTRKNMVLEYFHNKVFRAF